MIDPQLPLQAAIVAALKSDAQLTTLLGGRVFDRIPTDANGVIVGQFPFAAVGAADTTDEATSCIGPSECYIDINFLSRAVGYPEVKRIGARAAEVLDAALAVENFTVKRKRIERASYSREPDGLTSRARLRCRYGLLPSA